MVATTMKIAGVISNVIWSPAWEQASDDDQVDNIVTYLTSCHKLLALLLCVFLCHVLIQKWFARGEDTDPEQSTSSMALFLVLLPDSQFLCWSHSARVLVHVNKYGKKHFICLHHLGVSYMYIISYVPCRAHDMLPVCSTSMQLCVTYLVDCFTDSPFLCCACVYTLGVP